MDVFVTWLQSTSLSQAIVVRTWIWPAAETLHFVGLALVIGVIAFLDLRLIGCFPQVSLRAARELAPFALGGFLLNALTGLVFLIGHPEQYARNPAWWMKVAFLAVAGLNAFVFEWRLASRVIPIEEGRPMPLSAKCVGYVSLAAWFGVLYWGRMLPFIGNAY
jgi:hypothetical protein